VKLKLRCQDPLASVHEIIIESCPAELGRGENAAVRIDDRWLSRRHCRIEWVNDAFVVRDLGSRHGTYLNGRGVTECKLMPGDELCVGLTHLVAEYEPDSAALLAVS
jgi:pSer/pThr/pTyr-binding forkhead associated (FHA) protein